MCWCCFMRVIMHSTLKWTVGVQLALCIQGFCLCVLTNCGLKIFFKNSRKFLKANWIFHMLRAVYIVFILYSQLFTWHLHYIGITNILEIIYSLWEDVHRLYATISVYIRDLRISEFWYLWGVLDQIACEYHKVFTPWKMRNCYKSRLPFPFPIPPKELG